MSLSISKYLEVFEYLQGCELDEVSIHCSRSISHRILPEIIRKYGSVPVKWCVFGVYDSDTKIFVIRTVNGEDKIKTFILK